MTRNEKSFFVILTVFCSFGLQLLYLLPLCLVLQNESVYSLQIIWLTAVALFSLGYGLLARNTRMRGLNP